MKAVCWHGVNDVRVDNVPDPKIINSRDAIVKISTTCICGSDLHLVDGVIPTMESGDIMGHEFMGEVVEVAKGVSPDKLKVGDRVIVPFTIACGNCFYCKSEQWSLCDNSNPNAEMAQKLYGYSGSGLFGYSHMLGGFAGGQAEYARVPFADVGPFKVPESLTDEQVVFLTDILPTGYQAAVNAQIPPGGTVAVWGCGPVGQFTIKCCYLLGAGKVIAIDSEEDRLQLARDFGGAETLNFTKVNIPEALHEMTGGMGPDSCIDAVGMESHGFSADAVMDKVKVMLKLSTDRANALREVITTCGKGGTVSLPGVYGGFVDLFPLGAAFGKGLTFKMGQTHVHRYLPKLLEHIEKGEIQPEKIITHKISIDEAPGMYKTFRQRGNGCIKVVMKA